MEAIVITGADGFIGSNTVKYCLEQGKQVLALDVKKKPINLKPHPLLTYECIDIFNLTVLKNYIQENTYDTWIQFSWNGTSGDKREDYFLQVKNAINYADCVKIAKEKGCRRFVGAGSIMEKEVLTIMQMQDNNPQTTYIYGIGKLLAHYLCKTVATKVGIEFLWPIITNAYGPGERSPRFINSTIRKSIIGEALEFTSAVQNYDFVYMTDVAKAFYKIANKGKDKKEYVIGSGDAGPLRKFIFELSDVLGCRSEIKLGAAPYSGVNLPLEIFSINTLQQDTGYVPEVSFKDGIKRTRDWIVNETESM